MLVAAWPPVCQSLPVYQKPALKTKFGERAFSHAGPAAWNSLSDGSIKSNQMDLNTNRFKNYIKPIGLHRLFNFLFRFIVCRIIAGLLCRWTKSLYDDIFITRLTCICPDTVQYCIDCRVISISMQTVDAT